MAPTGAGKRVAGKAQREWADASGTVAVLGAAGLAPLQVVWETSDRVAGFSLSNAVFGLPCHLFCPCRVVSVLLWLPGGNKHLLNLRKMEWRE
jgi:hypothetical protein